MVFEQAIKDTICTRLAAGESLRAICRTPGIPAIQTVLDSVQQDPAFAGQYARARECGYQLLADEIVDIADEDNADTYLDEDGNLKTNGEVVARSRLRVDTRKWVLSKMLPKVYGDKLEQTIQGPGGGPVEMKSVIELVKPPARAE